MRWLATVVISVAALVQWCRVAAARPARDDTLTPFDSTDYCERPVKAWKRVTACQAKRGDVTLRYDSDQAKVITVAPRGEKGAYVHLYVQTAAGWRPAQMYAVTNDQSELLSITPYPTTGGAGMRIDLGVTFRSEISTDETTSMPGLRRHVNSIVCRLATRTCDERITACEAYVRGKVFWSYFGEPIWDAALGLRVRADNRNAGGTCSLLRSDVAIEVD